MIDYPLFAFLAALPIGLAVIVYDLRTMTIPNWLTGGAAVVFAAVVFAGLGVDAGLQRLLGGAIVLAAGFLLFYAGVIGGGDAKAAAAFAILVAPVDISFILIAMSVIGLVFIGVFAAVRTVSSSGITWKTPSPFGFVLGATLILYTAIVAFLMS